MVIIALSKLCYFITIAQTDTFAFYDEFLLYLNMKSGR